MARLNIAEWVRKYRYVLLVLLAGLVLMLLPAGTDPPETAVAPEPQEDMETRLEGILTRIQGAGKVAVMLTEAAGEEVIYQTDGEDADTVLLTDSARNQQGLVRTRQPPVYQGAVVVCSGADSPSVRLAVAQAVANVTGLGTDRIIVLKMK